MTIALMRFGFCSLLLLIAVERACADGWTPILRVGSIDQSIDDLNVIPLSGFDVAFDHLEQPLRPEQWPHLHPGVRDVWAGSRGYLLRTPVATPRRYGVYRIRIGVLGAHPYQPPRLRVTFGPSASWILKAPSGADISRQTERLEYLSPAVAEYLIAGQDLIDESTMLAIESIDDGSWIVYDGIEIDWIDAPLASEVGVDFHKEPARLVHRTPDGPRQQFRLTLDLRRVSTPLNLKIVDAAGGVWSEATLGLDAGHKRFYGPLTADLSIPAHEKAQDLKLEIRSDNFQKSYDLHWPGYRPIELYVVPQAHFDNGYTHTADQAVARNVDSLSRALAFGEKYENFSWTNESSYILQRWWQNANPADRDRLVDQVRSGRVGLDAGWVNLLTGLPNDEGLHRWLYWSGNFAREHRLDLKTASLTDSPSHVWSLPTILAGSGIEFLSIGSNSDRSDFWKFGADRAYQPVWWEGPDGARVLTMVHKHYAEATTVGLTMSLEAAEQRLPGYLTYIFDNPDAKEPYPYNVIHLHGAYFDNVQLDENLPAVVEQWNAKYEWPRLILGTNADFFERLRTEAAQHAPVVRGDQGAYWEDGAGSSAAETKLNRDSVRRLVLLEALLAGLHAQGKIRDYPKKLIDEAWENALLYDEHTWGAHHSVSLPDDPQTLTLFAVKAGYAMKSRLLCDQLQKIVDEGLAFTESWERDRRNSVAPESDALSFRSGYLAVDMDQTTGLIRSIRRTDDGREFVERSPAGGSVDAANSSGFGQVLYYAKQRGYPPSGSDVATGSTLSTPKLIDIQRKVRSIVSRYEHEILGIVELEVCVAADSPDIQCVLRMKGKRPVREMEGVYVSFPFAFKQPQIDYEVGGATVQAGRDWMPRACLDWFSVQDFVRLQDLKTGDDVVWSSPDAPLVSFQDVNTHKKLESLPIENGRIYSYVMNNYWHTNYQAQQGGDFEFRYFISFGRKTSLGQASLRATRWSPAICNALRAFVDIGSENIRMSSFKRAEDGDGYIVRIREVDGEHGDVKFSVPALAEVGIASVEVVSGIESPHMHPHGQTSAKGTEVSTHLHPFEVQTLRIRPGKRESDSNKKQATAP
ncbi:glycosyl hydrolase-related protein [Lacipirellula parvula]|uniref:Alpha-mannosidase n=1 Tax=Lacipirellula parvula TaxID=2650471 RepID=A0A5K7XAS5_9BACT|nr:glycosyl hydrolase-related protein [Lacipirellula parvula]BBO33824.1 hypothetical protein PLANPX_3436 [Lacipirellula parvula]